MNPGPLGYEVNTLTTTPQWFDTWCSLKTNIYLLGGGRGGQNWGHFITATFCSQYFVFYNTTLKKASFWVYFNYGLRWPLRLKARALYYCNFLRSELLIFWQKLWKLWREVLLLIKSHLAFDTNTESYMWNKTGAEINWDKPF